MITKSHIISFLLLVILYIAVGVWKYSASEDLTNHQNNSNLTPEEQVTKEFWEQYQQATADRTAGNYEKAIEHYKQALQRNPKHKDALYYLGSMHLFQREFIQAEKYWLQLEEIQKNTPRTQLQLGSLYSCMDDKNPLHDLKVAKEKFNYARDLNREETGAPLQLSKIAIINDNLAKAAELLDDILLSDSKNYQALFLRGYINWEEGNPEQGKDQLLDSWRTFQSLGHIEIQGEGATKKGARAMLSEALFCDPFRKNIENMLQQDINKLNFKTFDKALSALEKESK